MCGVWSLKKGNPSCLKAHPPQYRDWLVAHLEFTSNSWYWKKNWSLELKIFTWLFQLGTESHQFFRQNKLLSLKLTACPWNMMVGRRSPFLGFRPFRGYIWLLVLGSVPRPFAWFPLAVWLGFGWGERKFIWTLDMWWRLQHGATQLAARYVALGLVVKHPVQWGPFWGSAVVVVCSM